MRLKVTRMTLFCKRAPARPAESVEKYDDETGCSYVIKKSSDKLKPNSSEVKYAYSLKGQFKIDVILAQNFNYDGSLTTSQAAP